MCEREILSVQVTAGIEGDRAMGFVHELQFLLYPSEKKRVTIITSAKHEIVGILPIFPLCRWHFP